MTFEVDIAIIGAGTAGLSALQSAVRLGKKALLIDKGPLGTTCARVGCMPSKLLIAAANAAQAVRQAPQFGITVQESDWFVNGAKVMQRVQHERDRFVEFVLEELRAHEKSGRFIQGKARFLSDTQLKVEGHGLVRAQTILIATGVQPVIPPLLQEPELVERVVTNEAVFDWPTLPKRVAVLGGGVIGLELGQALQRLGVQVVVINRSEGLAGIQDPTVLATATAIFKHALDLRLQHDLSAATRNDDGSLCLQLIDNTTKQSHSLDVDYVLCAVGRRPDFTELELKKTSAVFDEQGRPLIDKQSLQICHTPIYLLGDANGLHPLLHEAVDDGREAAANAARWPVPGQPYPRRCPMSIVFSEPQLMRVGLTFKQLPAEVVIGESSFSNQGRARILLQNQGCLRVYAEPHSMRLLGAEMIGPAAEHMAHLLGWSIQQQLSLEQLLAMPFYHPVLEEGVRSALADARRQALAYNTLRTTSTSASTDSESDAK